jgi:hypothetical protein
MKILNWLTALFRRKDTATELIRTLPIHRVFTEQLKERQIVAVAIPGTVNNSTLTTGNGINMGIFRRARGILNVGSVTSSGSLNFKLRASATSGGSFSDITNLTTNPTILAITTANQPNAIEIRADMMPAGKPWLRAEVTETASQNVVVDLLLIGDESAYKPGNLVGGGATFTNDLESAV